MSTGLELMRQWYEGIDSHDLDRAVAVCATDCEVVAPSITVTGRDEIRAFLEGFVVALPDIEHRLQHITAAGELVVVELTGYGTNSGPLRTPTGQVEPTGRSLQLRACGVGRVMNGQLAWYHLYWDQMEFLGQLGLLAAPS